MNMNVYLPTRLMTGVGIINKQSQWLKKLGHKALIVTDEKSADICGALADVNAALDKEGIAYVHFNGITPNPKISECMEAAKIGIEANVDFIIGIGGGSPLDASKTISILTANQGMDQTTLYSLKWPVHPLPIVCVGTTAGTGSEVTKVAVMTNYEGFKKSFKDDRIYPTLSFGDPTYTAHMPDYFTKSTAIDAMAHSVESCFNKNANDISRTYATRSVAMLLPVFRQIIKDGCHSLSLDDRETLYNASLYGGMAINLTGTCMPHTVGYLMTEDYHIPHGFACAIFMNDFLRLNDKADSELVDSFVKAVGTNKDELYQIVDALLPDLDVNMSDEDVKKAHSRWVNNGSINNALMTIEPETIDAILTRLFVK